MHISSLLLCLATLAPQSAKRPLEVDDGDRWNSIRGIASSERGTWLGWQEEPADGSDGVLRIAGTEGLARMEVERGQGLAFEFDQSFAACLVEPAREVKRAWKNREKLKDAGGEAAASVPEHEPRGGLVLIDLVTRTRLEVGRVKAFRMPDEAGGWLAYLHFAPEKDKDKDKDEGEGEGEHEAEKHKLQAGEEPEAGEQTEARAPNQGAQETAAAPPPKKDSEVGTELVLRRLATGEEQRFEHVLSYSFSKDARFLAFVTSTKDGAGDGVWRLTLGQTLPVRLAGGRGTYEEPVFSENGERIAFLTDKDDQDRDEKEEKRFTLYMGVAGVGDARLVAGPQAQGLPVGWGVSRHRPPLFSDDGTRLYFGSAPLPEPPREELDEEDEVILDVWSWTDPEIQPQQLRRRQAELERSYLAVAHLTEHGQVLVQLGTPEVPDVALDERREGRWALGSSDKRWRAARQWDTDIPSDLWRIDTRTGGRRLVVDGGLGRPELSPCGRFAAWYEPGARQFFGVDLDAAEPLPRLLSGGIEHPLWYRLHDQPSLPRGYGSAGWLAGEAGLLVYDEFDVWLVDPSGDRPARCVTDGVGREREIRLRVIDLHPDEEAFALLDPLLLSAFDTKTKDAGFWRDELDGGGPPQEILMAVKFFSTPLKARSADRVWFTREDVGEFPDLWVASLALTDARRISDANPQQSEFNWASAELVEWRSAENQILQGLVYKPEGFDASRQYPLLVYFYERNSDSLHRHALPVAGRSSVSYSYYTSNAYVVFVPDIPYRVGFPGESCSDAVIPGILALIDKGYIDPQAIGVQGHSWGGYQIAYLVTQTDLFAAAVAGAPVANMTSAYGGIRYGTGMSRQFQYEKSQSRLGGTLWQVPDRYIANSPVFRADRVSTPLLMLHNDNDGAVPWTQGIEYFVALKRLEKPVWLLNYNGEDHGIAKYANRKDYATRMSQFFDHYLKGAPLAAWMADGIPAVRKGKTLGLELLTPAADK